MDAVCFLGLLISRRVVAVSSGLFCFLLFGATCIDQSVAQDLDPQASVTPLQLKLMQSRKFSGSKDSVLEAVFDYCQSSGGGVLDEVDGQYVCQWGGIRTITSPEAAKPESARKDSISGVLGKFVLGAAVYALTGVDPTAFGQSEAEKTRAESQSRRDCRHVLAFSPCDCFNVRKMRFELGALAEDEIIVRVRMYRGGGDCLSGEPMQEIKDPGSYSELFSVLGDFLFSDGLQLDLTIQE